MCIYRQRDSMYKLLKYEIVWYLFEIFKLFNRVRIQDVCWEWQELRLEMAVEVSLWKVLYVKLVLDFIL